MKAEAMALTFLGNEQSVKIPFFQRAYVWNKSNWEDILMDLFDFNKSHFLGSLILKQLEKQTGKHKEVLIIDGQQRLTTLSILLRALYDTFESEFQENAKGSIQTYLFYKKQQTDKLSHLKISHSKVDALYYKKIICNELSENEIEKIIVEDNQVKIHSTDNKILQCYKYFIGKLNDYDPQKRIDLFNRLLDAENKILVVIDLTEKEDEQAIFDTINSAGVRLSSADIIKNAIFQKALDIYEDQDEVLTLYKENWEDIFSPDEEKIIFWSTQRVTGRLVRDNIEILLHSISVIKGFFYPEKHTLSDLSNLYKLFILNLDQKELESFILEISKYAKLYNEKIVVLKRDTLFSYQDSYLRLFHILDVCEISTFHPYILSLFFKYDTDELRLKSELLKLERFIVRRMIAKEETKSYNKTCKELISNNDLINIKINEIPDDKIFLGLENINNKNASLLLFWIELFRRHNDTKQSVKELKYDYSLEHLMPQKWEEFWSNVDVVDSKSNVIYDKETAKKERSSRLYFLGNMTLLNSSLNTSLRNFQFDRKIEGEGRKRGIRQYADLWITKDDIIYKFDNGERVWNEFRILERTHKLGNEIIQMW